jgi:AcrR family transcriptional regulator
MAKASDYRNQLHRTAELLIATALELMESKPVDKVTVEEVLNTSGVARSSLYHHFEDFHHLMEMALIRRFTKDADAAIAQLLTTADDTDSFDKAREVIHEWSHFIQHVGRRQNRMARIVAIATADRNERFRDMLSKEQQRITDGYAEAFRIGQERGWINPRLTPVFLATLLQAYTVGRAVDDVSATSLSNEEWLSGIDILQDTFFLNPELTRGINPPQ